MRWLVGRSDMLEYRGFQLIEYVTVHHRNHGRFYGGHGVSVHDNLYGIISDHPTMAAAKRWIDRQIDKADMMLERTLA